jgi:membrane protease subunit HflC
MTAMLQRNRVLLFAFGCVALLLGLCVTVVPETSQAVVLRMGEPVRVVNRWSAGETGGGGGLLVHWPFVERVEWTSRGLTTITAERLTVRSADQQQLNLDATATVRIFDPVKLVNSAGTGEKAVDQIRAVLRSLAPPELGQAEAGRMLMPGSGGAAARLRSALDSKARAVGVQVIDLRLSAASLPEPELQQAYERMEADRARIAATEAEQGARDAQRISDQARSDAARILGTAAGKDPEFYDFYRAMRSYEVIFADPNRKADTTIILGPDNEYLKQFKGK